MRTLIWSLTLALAGGTGYWLVRASTRPGFSAPDVARQISSNKLPRTLSGAMAVCEPQAKREFEGQCRNAGLRWPPARITLLAFKQERILEAWGANNAGPYSLLARYPILAASGTLGPKRREGDLQVPEGFYRIDSLNPASRFHLSLRVDYPNAEDRRHADGPNPRLGGDIYVHGNAVSIGCIAIGDGPIERIFALTALARASERRIIIAPVDFRNDSTVTPTQDDWVRDLYGRLRAELKARYTH
jgi:hypothetical protein